MIKKFNHGFDVRYTWDLSAGQDVDIGWQRPQYRARVHYLLSTRTRSFRKPWISRSSKELQSTRKRLQVGQTNSVNEAAKWSNTLQANFEHLRCTTSVFFDDTQLSVTMRISPGHKIITLSAYCARVTKSFVRKSWPKLPSPSSTQGFPWSHTATHYVQSEK